MHPSFADLLEQRLAHGLDAPLERILGATVPRMGAASHYAVVASGRFRGAITADLLAFTHNNQVDGALVLVEDDTERVLYFDQGVLIGAASSVLFERVGRILYRAGTMTHEASNILIDIEEQRGRDALREWVPEDTLAWAEERRVWEVVAALYLAAGGHFVLVEGRPDLNRALTTRLDPMQVALEGMRRHDQWRNQPARTEEAPPPMPEAQLLELAADPAPPLRPVAPVRRRKRRRA